MSLFDYSEEIEVLKSDHYMPLTQYKSGSWQQKQYLLTKRMLDLFCSGIGLIFFLPLFLVTALLIKLEDSKDPIFFKQMRVGKDGKLFKMYKFRSMKSDAEQLLPSIVHLNEVSGAMFKMKDDPRVTIIGRFIRKTSIDELPQLWNVMKGEMSLVGPRPPLPKEVEVYNAYDKQRLLVKPGCTGLWQVSGRNRIGFKEMVELDLKYIKNRSLMNDIYIILRTVRVLIGSKDAF